LTKEPLVEEVEDREQLLLGGRAAPPRLGLDPAMRPALLPLLQEREDELVLRGEVAVERGLRDRGALDHLLDSHRTHPAAREELVGTRQDAVAGDRLGTHGLEPTKWDRPVWPARAPCGPNVTLSRMSIEILYCPV
jgi:hypothetical protein